MTQWVGDRLDEARRAATERRDRTALRHVLEVLSVYPEEPDGLALAGMVLKLNMGRTTLEASREPLLQAEVSDPRLDRLFCSCNGAGCTVTWISAKVGLPGFAEISVVNPIGGRCPQCGQYYCRRHFRPGGLCPNCPVALDPAPPPNGRRSRQTARLNKPLVHVFVFAEGPIQPAPDSLMELLQVVAPDVMEDRPKITAIPIGPWRDDVQGIATAKLALDYEAYLTDAYELRTAELRDAHGARFVIAKVFANRPKIVDPS
jgi:hypothetical protein